MVQWKPIVPAVLFFAALVCAAPLHAGDSIRLSNVGSGESGAIVDGLRLGNQANDKAFTSLQPGGLFGTLFPVIPLDNFTASSESNELIAFSFGRPPILRTSVPWTPGNNTVEIDFDDTYRIPVTVWVVYGPFDEQIDGVLDANVTTSMIWFDERQGVEFSEFEIVDATLDPDASQFHEFHCSKKTQMTELIGFVEGRVNIYYVDTVNFGNGPGTANGVWCGSGIIGMGSTTKPHLLTHELGHAFNIQHVNGNPEHFDTTNIMHSSSFQRDYLTEGQTFRSVYRPSSALNDIYDVRQGAPTRTCIYSVDTEIAACPPTQKRIWADGAAWPPN